MKNYTDLLIEAYTDELVPQWLELNIEPWRFNYLAREKWRCPKNAENRKILPEEEWNKLRDDFVSQGKNVEVLPEAEIVSTYHNEYGKSYLAWIKFWGSDGQNHAIDVYISELDSKKNKNAEKHIDPRSPTCAYILNSILEVGAIPVDIAKLLPSIGSKTWTGTVESKVQKKLNSYIQAMIFEDAARACGVRAIQLDDFDTYLYRGDPGQLADYDLVFNINGKEFTVRIDLKLIQESTDLASQKVHDAEILISSDWRTDEVKYHRVSGTSWIEDTEEFKKLLQVFSQKQKEAGKCFIHINYIDLDTGKVDYIKF